MKYFIYFVVLKASPNTYHLRIEYMEDVFADPNDINEDTRIQIELINRTLAELQVRNKEREKRPRPRIGFIRYDEDSTEK